ncbi:hypothetical protein [Actinomadura litoris]|uniref:Uncharacterized protein n=1 Tax=Actinomadura litoris TaxID=2678616 RepID=A0A7K1L457_9ACTN|nr:hypothetical protein [Actinomadura litoris]MUN39218.1 hypothetical protein [Actinomadura litoris]
MAGTMRVPRGRGALGGVLLVLLGTWGGLLPFVGPYLDFGFAPDDAWVYDSDRLQLSVAPGAATALGGLVVLVTASRVLAVLGAWLAVLGGAWFAVGGPVAALWDVPGVGAPLGTEQGRRVAEQLAGFTGLGVAVVLVAALTLGRFTVRGAPPAGSERDEEERPSSGTTQPLVYGRYARETPPPSLGTRPAPPPGPPGSQEPPGLTGFPPRDQRVAGDRREDR